ncbi:hypothetical protein [Mesobacillus jeotgali]|uniref:hypothetical protein n=1 Tax=Mesobacillus jeotgali TaxID=129985 RepID=UPI0009A8292C|nr:hypothetical protein [Mesobacillus jeotgali]
MKFGRIALIILCVLLIVIIINYFQQIQEEKYEGLEIIPEHTEDIPVYIGLEAESPVYKIKGDHWADIMRFYNLELPDNGWSLNMQQSSPDSSEDGAGFISSWEKEGKDWILTIRGAYYKNTDQTEVTYDRTEPLKAAPWIETEVSEICINEQPDRSQDCFMMTDKNTIDRITEMINSATEADNQQIDYKEKSAIQFNTMKITVYYDLEKGIYFLSEKGTKWMKPEKEFFELTRISKEY